MICGAILAAVAGFCLWYERDAFQYLAHTQEGAWHVLRESTGQLLYTSKTSPPITSGAQDAHEDSYFARRGEGSARGPRLGVVSGEIDIQALNLRISRAYNFPLQVPQYDQPKPPPVHVGPVRVPESIRKSPSIEPPVSM